VLLRLIQYHTGLFHSLFVLRSSLWVYRPYSYLPQSSNSYLQLQGSPSEWIFGKYKPRISWQVSKYVQHYHFLYQRCLISRQYFFVGEVFYFALLGLCKISILLFYLRIFPSRTLQISCYVVIIYVTAFTVTIDFLAIFQCTPLSYNWEGWKGNMERRCIDSNTQILVAAANTIAQDFIVLLLPLPWLVRLKVELWKKINVLWMFSAGIL
jgi:hypothetical protein